MKNNELKLSESWVGRIVVDKESEESFSDTDIENDGFSHSCTFFVCYKAGMRFQGVQDINTNHWQTKKIQITCYMRPPGFCTKV